ncbi:hypothetical protein IFM89_012403 [Coptis chinensis]|uniref:Cytochrome c-type biogenesis protein n=1 Tax=Coptis chinensis TaxID=261450 RepID=A0A835M005_9MAGN|nr:hypothetical protein IFM89_012403 [Coptis chinensis]
MDKGDETVTKQRIVDARARNISHNVRCTECGGQSIEDSQADIAILLRQIIRDEIRGGKSDKEIYKRLEKDYGETVLYEPKYKCECGHPIVVKEDAGENSCNFFSGIDPPASLSADSRVDDLQCHNRALQNNQLDFSVFRVERRDLELLRRLGEEKKKNRGIGEQVRKDLLVIEIGHSVGSVWMVDYFVEVNIILLYIVNC